ncbi:hypothetical protein HPB50_019390 [Hyalomma asiaticum]|uniref:Uncharacterized protein n=1 Tax=Hyalomma asiaticum TaxID=266040 RepID=A0ACB7SLJ4_HYAAI|nr:hypothetical protein HPB50_019390 [Hyalomma asiaticum]
MKPAGLATIISEGKNALESRIRLVFYCGYVELPAKIHSAFPECVISRPFHERRCIRWPLVVIRGKAASAG